ncbi:MAG: hypothetical protein COB04_09440 [Gammaproteobacteria bacterium]|nr:MAG: hypothetical protein COB04_09440 [Gammaproteobacteria bacterium]
MPRVQQLSVSPLKHTSYCVVVTYKPELTLLLKNLNALRSQVDYLHIIDNSAAHWVKEAIHEHAILINEITEFDQNKGLGYALNFAAECAKQKGFPYLLIMDQDSTPQRNMVQSLLNAFATDNHLAAAGPFSAPNIHEIDTGFFICNQDHNNVQKRYYQQLTKSAYDVEFLFSSGTLIKIQALTEIGDFKSDYFIDHIDTEWCFRAIAKGFHLKGLPQTFMAHKIGIRHIKLWLGRSIIFPIHEPIRNYYTFRNSLLTYKLDHTPRYWKLKTLVRLSGLLLINLTLANQRLLRLQMMIAGITDGLRPKHQVQIEIRDQELRQWSLKFKILRLLGHKKP